MAACGKVMHQVLDAAWNQEEQALSKQHYSWAMYPGEELVMEIPVVLGEKGWPEEQVVGVMIQWPEGCCGHF